jgi:hypothetical protein
VALIRAEPATQSRYAIILQKQWFGAYWLALTLHHIFSHKRLFAFCAAEFLSGKLFDISCRFEFITSPAGLLRAKFGVANLCIRFGTTIGKLWQTVNIPVFLFLQTSKERSWLFILKFYSLRLRYRCWLYSTPRVKCFQKTVVRFCLIKFTFFLIFNRF